MAISGIRPSVEQLRELGNFTQMFRWGVVVSQFPAMMSGYNSQDINFRAESASIPEKTGETTTITIRGNEVRQPGKHTYNSPITLVLVETAVDVLVQRFVHDWHNLCWLTDNGSLGTTQLKSDLEAVIDLYLLNSLDQPIYKYKLIGCFLETPTKGDLDSSTSDPMKPSLSIAYDYFTEENLV